jgi:hypothetical protein
MSASTETINRDPDSFRAAPGLNRSEAVRKAQQLRIAADMKNLADGERASGVT